MWWAGGQLEALRSMCVNLARLKYNFADPDAGEEPYFKIEQALPVEQLSALQATFCPLEAEALLESCRAVVRFYRELAIPLAREHGLDYPEALERVMMSRLENLRSQS